MRAGMGTTELGIAPSMGSSPLPRGVGWHIASAVEAFLDRERDQLALWLPVALGAGISAWFVLPGVAQWAAWIAAMLALAAGALVFPKGSRFRRAVVVAALASALGCGVIWVRAMWVAAPVLTAPTVAEFTASVERVEVQSAKDRIRLILSPIDAPTLPPRVRVTVDDVMKAGSFVRGDRVSLKARLVGPQAASVPGGFDFSRVAWFQELGATGKAVGSV